MPSVDIEDAETVITGADGWAAALVAGASQMRVARQWRTDEIAVELLGAWFAELPPHRRDFLIATTVLAELAAGPAAAVTGDPERRRAIAGTRDRACLRAAGPGAGGTLGALVGAASAAHRTVDAVLVRGRVAAHSAAAEWFMASDDVPGLCTHLVASGRSEDAGRFLTHHESELFAKGRADEIPQWYDQIGAGYHDRIGHLIRVGWGQALSMTFVAPTRRWR